MGHDPLFSAGSEDVKLEKLLGGVTGNLAFESPDLSVTVSGGTVRPKVTVIYKPKAVRIFSEALPSNTGMPTYYHQNLAIDLKTEENGYGANAICSVTEADHGQQMGVTVGSEKALFDGG